MWMCGMKPGRDHELRKLEVSIWGLWFSRLIPGNFPIRSHTKGELALVLGLVVTHGPLFPVSMCCLSKVVLLIGLETGDID